MPKVKIGPMKTHLGVCDASGAVFLRRGSTEFLVADDEDQQQTTLRLYDAAVSGRPSKEVHLSNDVLGPDEDEPEIDLEASAWIGDRIFWIGSHSRSKNAKARPSRRRLFATRMNGDKVGIVGHPYSKLLDDLSRKLDLDLDKKLAPKDGGVSIEGLSATENEGEVIIAFRSPLVKKKALLIVLKNAAAVVDDGRSPKFADPVLLDLDGLGIRSIDYWPERKAYYLLAGPAGDNGKEFQLMRWPGPSKAAPKSIDAVDFAAMKIGDDEAPEALLIEPESETVYILFDEGNRIVNGVKCKNSPEQSFRSMSVSGL